MFDICVNLDSDRFQSDRQEVLARAYQQGITTIALTGNNLGSSKRMTDLAATDPARLCSTAGIHPHDADSYNESMWPELVHLAKHPRVKAVGECGLDHNRQFSPSPQQEVCFRAHISLAEQINKPLFLHQRDAFAEFVRIIDEMAPTVPMIVHCFTDGPRELDQLLDRGCFIGITGWICDDRRNSQLKLAVKNLPLDRVMIETDAPWLTPRSLKKVRRNEPAYLPIVAQRLAEEMNVTLDELVQHSTENAKRFFGMP